MPLDLISNGQVIVWFTILQSVLLFCIFNPRTGYSPLSLLSYLISIPVIFNSSPCSAPPSTTPIHLPAYSVMATFQSFLPNANPIYNPSRHLRSRQDHRHRHHSRSTPSHNYFNKYSTKMRRLRPLPTAPTSFLSEEQKNKSALVALPVVDGRMAGLDNQLDLYQARERKKATVSDLSSAIQATTTVWQLYNHCSAGFVQTFMGITNANGRVEDVCLINFLVHSLQDGLIMLEQAKLHSFLCFNRRRRLAVRKLKHNDVKCQFREHMTKSGYTLLESAWTPGLYLGFNRKGRFQDPSQFNNTKLHRCFHYSKLEVGTGNFPHQLLDCRKTHEIDNKKVDWLQSLQEGHNNEQKLMYEVARNTILTRVEI